MDKYIRTIFDELNDVINSIQIISQKQKDEMDELMQHIQIYAPTVPYTYSDIIGNFSDWLRREVATEKHKDKVLVDMWHMYLGK